MKLQSPNKKVEGHLFFNREDIGSYQLVRLAETQDLKHICIDKEDLSHYLLMLKVLNANLIPSELDKVFGYKTESPLQITFYYVNEIQHQTLQSILTTPDVCEVQNDKEDNTEETP